MNFYKSTREYLKPICNVSRTILKQLIQKRKW